MTRHDPLPDRQRRLTIDQAYRAAVALHRQGRLSEAEQAYRSVLQIESDHFGALHQLAELSNHTGRAGEAAQLITRALTLQPDSAAAYNTLGTALLAQRQTEEAIACYRRAIAARPDLVEAYSNLGTALLSLQRPQEAVEQFESALAMRPQLAELHNNLGSALAALDRHDEAIACYRRALDRRADFAEAHCNLGISLTALGRAEQAIVAFNEAIGVRGLYADAYLGLADALRRTDGPAAAIPQLQTALAIRPDADTFNNLGHALAELERHAEAVVQFEKALSLRPDLAAAYNNLGNSLAALRKYAAAQSCYRRALAIQPGFAEAHGNLGNTLAALNQPEQAAASFEAALALNPDLPDVHHNLGSALRALGRLAESERAYERAIALAPQRAELYRGFAESKRLTAGDPLLIAMERLARDMSGLSPQALIELHFGLAKAYDDIGRYDDAFAHLRQGNALKRQAVDYDEAETVGRLRRIAELFTPEVMHRHRGCGDPAPEPVFIIGMPRSGTTLVEQILASHPNVFGAGELMNFAQAVRDDFPEFPEGVSALGDERFREIGAGYTAGVRTLAPTAHITDKMPSNFRFAGLIHLSLPNARIIHVRRDPIDTCLSCFFKIFTGNQPFAYDLQELGRFYRAYATLMAHWRNVIPTAAMLEVNYEDLVTDLEKHARHIVGHCRLEWDASCLTFYRTSRPVNTGSAVQVRQPIYRSAVGRWRNYQNWLAPLLEALGDI